MLIFSLYFATWKCLPITFKKTNSPNWVYQIRKNNCIYIKCQNLGHVEGQYALQKTDKVKENRMIALFLSFLHVQKQRAISVNGTDNIKLTIFLNNLTLMFDEVTLETKQIEKCLAWSQLMKPSCFVTLSNYLLISR